MGENNFGIGLEYAWQLLCIRRGHNIYNYECHCDIVTCLRFVAFYFLNIIIFSNIFYNFMHIVNEHVILLQF